MSKWEQRALFDRDREAISAALVGLGYPPPRFAENYGTIEGVGFKFPNGRRQAINCDDGLTVEEWIANVQGMISLDGEAIDPPDKS